MAASEDEAGLTAGETSQQRMHGAAANHDEDPIENKDLAHDDPYNPRNWSERRKWALVAVIVPIDLSVSWAASGFSPAQTKFVDDLGRGSSEIGTLGLSLYVLGLALGPLTLAPLSEFYGRSPIYIGFYGVFLLFLLGTALVQNLGGFLVLRILSGLFSSVTIANFGGSIADMWPVSKTGLPMSIFLWAATCGSPSGYLLFAFVAGTRPWRDVFWALLGVCGGFWLIMTAVLLYIGETRHSVIAKRKQARLAENNGRRPPKSKLSIAARVKTAAETLFTKALSRPFRFLLTEAIVIFGSLYNGYLYGLSFLFNSAFDVVFGDKHGFDTIQVGLAFLGITVGITLGPLTNLLQERHYQQALLKNGGRNTPEARVWMGKVAAVVFPVSLFWFAWTTYSSIHWIVPIIASAFWGWSFYTLILMTYTYTEDSYKTFSASALAGIGLIRNLAGAGFPLFGRQMFTYSGFGGIEGRSTQYAATILACLACVLVPIPFILEKYGVKLRKRSPWASRHMDDEADEGVKNVDSGAITGDGDV